MSFLRAGVALGVGLFLIVDMAIVHQLLRLHGVLFSNYFEYTVALISAAFAAKSILRRDWSFTDRLVRDGILLGIGGTLFLDVVLVDQILRLHAVNYPESINIGSGMVGLILVVLGLYGWRIHANQGRIS